MPQIFLQRRSFQRITTGMAVMLALGARAQVFSSGNEFKVSPHTKVRVGPSRGIRTIARAAKLATPGAFIEVDAGDYVNDVAVWEHDDITVRSVGGRVRLLAQGAAAEGKGIWVVRARRMRVQGFDFEGCTVPSRNGAGIRFESGSLLLRDCSFMLNEMGLLTNNSSDAVLDVQNCEFAHNMRPDGHNHNLYVGSIARLSVTGSYFHHARVGHLLKSRAAVNHVFYNRLTDEAGGSASYELEFPSGGLAYVVGNLIEQGRQTDNPILVSVGAEGYKWPRNEIHLVHNTLINPLAKDGLFLRVVPGANQTRAWNNLLVGDGDIESGGNGDYFQNFHADAADFANLGAYDLRLSSSSHLRGLATGAGTANGQNLTPKREYAHPRGTRSVGASTHNPGAMQSLA